MLLVADVGNTSTVFVVYDGDTVVDTIRTKTGDHKVKELTEKYYPVNMAFISSVVPSVNERLKKYLEYLYYALYFSKTFLPCLSHKLY